jgi:hypothetical protein
MFNKLLGKKDATPPNASATAPKKDKVCEMNFFTENFIKN